MKKYIQLFRIKQWIKNLFVFVPLLFSQHLFHEEYAFTTAAAFILFCLVSSVVYIINDIIDIEADKLHPVKKFRPLPSGALSKKEALISAVILSIIIVSSFPLFNLLFILSVIVYFLLNLSYSLALKHIVLIDLFCIAAGFMIRVVAGAFVINVEISSWLILTTMFISLFLAIMKRRSEIENAPADSASARKVLEYYSINFTEQLAVIAAAGVIISYALYTVSARTVYIFGTENLIYTTPFVVFGIFRYMFLVYMNRKGENTSEILVSDIPMILNILLYIIVVTMIIYI